MIDPKGHWRIVEAKGNHPASISFKKDGEAWSVRCKRYGGLPDLLGVGFIHGDFLCIARGLVQQDADLGQKVGLVRYDLNMPGKLPAKWYHCSLKGKISDGLSSNGPTSTIIGEYQADYANSDGMAFNPLRKTITQHKHCLQFSWWDDEKFYYLGVGCIIAGNLYAAWGPPGAIIQFVYYNLNSSRSALHGQWYDFGRNLSGTEILAR